MAAHLAPQPHLDQHFLIDDKVLDLIVKAAKIKRTDTILEIGPGTGVLTQLLALHAKKIYAVDIDARFKEVVEKIPHTEFFLMNAIDFLTKARGDGNNNFNKIISNLPYQICEPLLHYLCQTKNVELTVLTIPKRFALKAKQHPIFSTFLNIEILKEVPKTAFNPPPRVTSAVVKITPNTEESEKQFIVRKMYWQRDKKLRNGLRETIIDFYGWKFYQEITKKQAEKIIDSLSNYFSWSDKLWETKIAVMPLEIYNKITLAIKSLNKSN